MDGEDSILILILKINSPQGNKQVINHFFRRTTKCALLWSKL